MSRPQNINIQEESDLKRILDLLFKNYKFFIICIIFALGLAFLKNRYSTPIYSISSSILVKEKNEQRTPDVNEYINSSLFGKNENFQNELWIMKSTPIVEKTTRNLDLSLSYIIEGRFQSIDAYQEVPFKVSYLQNHPQPVNIKFRISFITDEYFQLSASAKDAYFYNIETNKPSHQKVNWIFTKNAKFGELIETPDLSFIIEPVDTTKKLLNENRFSYGFYFQTYNSLVNLMKERLDFKVVDKLATVIEINLKSESVKKGITFLNELMNVYSEQNLEQKNHIATITIDYIEKQLDEISDSLSQTEDNLQSFRSSNQLLNISDQSAGISAQNMNLQNQLAELISRKRYYDYVSNLLKNDNYSDVMLPVSIGIQDQLLNNLMSELITAQAQRANLIQNKQERNPLVQKLSIQIETIKKTISENIAAAAITTSISIDEMTKRIKKLEAEISRLPITQRRLGNIERKYRLNDAIYNYMLEKRAEAKITKASNMPDDIIIEPAKMEGSGPISPNGIKIYLAALFLGFALPFGVVWTKSLLNNKIESQDDLERLTDKPVLGKILHNRYKTRNVMFEYPKSNIAESFRALRTNLDFYVRSGQKKIILVTSCLENEGKSFIALNLAMSYAQLGRKTILVDFDLRKPKTYFKVGEESLEGLSSYMIDKVRLEDIIMNSPHDKMDYILSGILPPNPVELIALEKTKELLSTLKSCYDIIVLDTTPLAQVTDAYLLIDNAEVKILITRYGNTIKNVFSLIIKDLNQKNLSNICIVLNDNKAYADQYGYGYGYYNKEGFFSRIIKRKKVRS